MNIKGIVIQTDEMTVLFVGIPTECKTLFLYNHCEEKRKSMVKIVKYQNQMMFLSVPFLVLGFLLHDNVFCFLAVTVLCGIPVLYRAITALHYRLISIELLVSIAVAGALFIHEYHECAMVTFLFQIGMYLEGRSMKKTRSAITSLTEHAPDMALKITESGYEEIDADDVEKGDILLVREGCRVPADGVVTEGEAWVNESMVTGEYEPNHKEEKSQVYAGTVITDGTFQMRAEKVGENTTYAGIIELVEEAEDAKSSVERFIDQFAKYYTPAVIVISAVVFLLTKNVDTSITVLVLACPGALVIGAPIAGICGIGRGAKEGILFKGSEVMHTFTKTDTFLFDKTGTLTKGIMHVNAVKSYTEKTDMYISICSEMEKESTHPIGSAITAYATEQNSIYCGGKLSVSVIKGKGLLAGNYLVGNEILMKDNGVILSEGMKRDIAEIKDSGNTVVLMANEKKLVLIMGIADVLQNNVKETVDELKKLTYGKCYMLTGDHQKSAEYISEEIKLDGFESDMLPEDKYAYVEKIQKEGHTVCFVGDGINDSPSIVKADTGIAVGSGTDVAIECSAIVILNNDISRISRAYEISKKTVAITHENIVIAVGTVIFLIAGLFAGWIHMGSGMFIHELSILAVILNGMRLQKGKKK